MSAHTPGPWRKGLHPQSVVADAPVPQIQGSDDVSYYGGHLIAESVAPQNIPLIAAAPELLAALKDVVRSCRKDFLHEADPDGTFRKAYAEELALIAKAEGRA